MALNDSAASKYPKTSHRIWEEVPGLVSLMLFLVVTALLFRSWEFGLIVTASLGFHELGHLAALSWYHLDGRICFGLAGAYTWSSMPARARLSQMANVYIHLTGPVFSLILSGLALLLNSLWQPESRHLLILANFSAQVGLLNLLPAGPLTDGGKVIQRMLSSLGGQRRRWVTVLPVVFSVILLTLFLLVELPRFYAHESNSFLLGLLLVGIWLAGTLLLEARQVDRRITRAPRPMNVRQAGLVLLIIWNLMAFYVLILTATPFWLEPRYIRGSLENVLDVLRFLF